MHVTDITPGIVPAFTVCDAKKHVRVCTYLCLQPKAIGAELGELQIRFYPNMPGKSTSHVQEKVDLQGEVMPQLFFADAEDCVCPVTTVTQLMKGP